MKIDPNQALLFIWQGFCMTLGFKIALFALTFLPSSLGR